MSGNFSKFFPCFVHVRDGFKVGAPIPLKHRWSGKKKRKRKIRWAPLIALHVSTDQRWFISLLKKKSIDEVHWHSIALTKQLVLQATTEWPMCLCKCGATWNRAVGAKKHWISTSTEADVLLMICPAFDGADLRPCVFGVHSVGSDQSTKNSNSKFNF